MSSRRLPNYLRTFRKRSGLSQDEVAFLLGSPNGGIVSRYEQFNRSPNLETSFALVAVFGVRGRELFAGTFEDMKKRIARRARMLEKRVSRNDPIAGQKLNVLRSIGASLQPQS